MVVFAERALAHSETFIKHHIEALRRYRPTLVVLRQTTNDLPDCPRVVVNRSGRAGEMVREGATKFFGWNSEIQAHFKRARLVHAHFGTTGFVASKLTRRAGKPLLVTLHGFDVQPIRAPREVRSLLHFLYWINRQRLWNCTHTFLCVSKFLHDRAVAIGFPPEKCKVHYLGIPLRGLNPARIRREGPSAGFRIIAVGRLIGWKGHDHLIDALAEVERAGVRLHFSIFGDGPLRRQLEARAQDRLRDFTFHGMRPHAEVIEALRHADLMCHSSITLANGLTEALGLAVVEAQAVGVPVVAFRSGGVAEAVADGRTGLLVDDPTPGAMAGAILTVLRNGDLRQRFAAEGPGFVRRNFDLDRQTRALETIYDAVSCSEGDCTRALVP